MNIQYLGFEQDLKCRRYSFRVIETLKQDREFQLSVENQDHSSLQVQVSGYS